MFDLVLSRTYSSPTFGTISGNLVVGGKTFYTVERVGTPWLRLGTYVVAMDTKRERRKVPCLRPQECAFQTMLIHDADSDDFRSLSGCIAPGLQRDTVTGSIAKSAEAMRMIMDLLGGFPGEEGKVFSLLVANNVPGGTGTRESNLPARRAAILEDREIECPVN